MKRPITATVLTILAGLAYSAPALAHWYDVGPSENTPGIKIQTPTFDEADRNGNKTVTFPEAAMVGVPTSEAMSADLDGNKLLSGSEWEFVSAKGETDLDSEDFDMNWMDDNS